MVRARSSLPREGSLSIIRWTISNGRRRRREARGKRAHWTRYARAGAAARATRTSLREIRATSSAQPERRTNQIWIQTSGGRERQTSWLRPNGYGLAGFHRLERSHQNQSGRGTVWIEGRFVLDGAVRHRASRRGATVPEGIVTEKSSESAEFTRQRVRPLFRNTPNGGTEGGCTPVISYSLKRRERERRASGYVLGTAKRTIPRDPLAQLRAQWKHKKLSRCWQPRFVTKSTIRCCPVRPWPREYHAASSADRTRGRPWRCCRRL